jgi:hypothetical protein
VWFVGRTISDEEWLGQAKPLYKAALPLMMALNDAVAKESIEDEISAVGEAFNKLPFIAEGIKRLPTPTSPEARLAMKKLNSAMKYYVDGIKQGRLFARDLYGGPGERLRLGGMSRRAAAARLTFTKSTFESCIEVAQKKMAEANAYFPLDR